MKVYICGPVTGIEDMNKASFYGAELILKSLRYGVTNPIRLCEHVAPDQWEEAMKVCIKAMLDCELVVLLDGWQQSKGATLERKIALSVGIEVKLLTEIIR